MLRIEGVIPKNFNMDCYVEVFDLLLSAYRSWLPVTWMGRSVDGEIVPVRDTYADSGDPHIYKILRFEALASFEPVLI